jgi:hypothetical protein
MRRPRTTIVGLMAAVAVVALDFSLIRMMGYERGLVIGIALNVGIVRWWSSRGPSRRFWAGFEAIGLAAVLAFIGCSEAFPDTVPVCPLVPLYGLVPGLPTTTARRTAYYLAFPREIDPWHIIVILWEMAYYGLPMVLLATLGGSLAARSRFHRYSRSGLPESV